jgi:hypothetical protein
MQSTLLRPNRDLPRSDRVHFARILVAWQGFAISRQVLATVGSPRLRERSAELWEGQLTCRGTDAVSPLSHGSPAPETKGIDGGDGRAGRRRSYSRRWQGRKHGLSVSRRAQCQLQTRQARLSTGASTMKETVPKAHPDQSRIHLARKDFLSTLPRKAKI